MVLFGKLIWLVGIVGWCLIRHPFQRKAKRFRVVAHRRSAAESAGLIAATVGLGILPLSYVLTGFPSGADYRPLALAVSIGAVVYGGAMWLFWRSHKDLGRNWSISLEVRQEHCLVTTGVYQIVRHPMYTAFWLMAIGQALLLSNWVAGFAGLAGFALLYFVRVRREEALMLDVFGDEYRSYMARTKRLIPHVY